MSNKYIKLSDLAQVPGIGKKTLERIRNTVKIYTFDEQKVAECIDNSPTIDAVPVVCGEWKRGREFSSYPRVPFIGDAYYCSNCEEEAYWDTDYGQQLFGFCPNCGAKMEVEP